MADGCYYFRCTVSFQCPICERTSAERSVYEARSPDPKRVALALSRQSLDCQLCGATLVTRGALNIRVVPTELDRLRSLEIPIRRAAHKAA
jgi:hypothetical protein